MSLHCICIIFDCLFSLVLVFFWYVSQAVTEPSDNSNDECSAEVYVGTVCRASLHSLQSCIPDRCNTTEVYIPSTGNQSELEQQLTALLGGLQRLEPGPECQAAVVPFLCSYYFRLCDSDGRVHQPSSAECATIASETCAAEFQRAIQILGSGNLPRCDVLPPIGIDCQSGGKFSFLNPFNSENLYRQFFE